ncbi:polysaccharide deacetylase family protein [Sphingopyxis sp. 550A]
MTRKTVSFCFDDGFLESSRKTADLFEARGLRATFCAMASPANSNDSAHRGGVFVDWPLWRRWLASGHDVAPHGWAHERLSDMPFEQACRSLERMFEMFEAELPGFDPATSIFHTPYLSLPPALLDWVGARVAGVRLATGGGGINRRAGVAAKRPIDCIAFGPDGVAASAQRQIEAFARSDGDWLCLVLHGLDGEGWGALALGELAVLVDSCLHLEMDILPLIDIVRPERQ